VLAGFDSQTSSDTRGARPAFFRDLIARVDSGYARSVYIRDSSFLAKRGGPERTQITSDRDAFVAFYDSLATWFRENERRLASLVPDDPFAPMIARQTALSMIAYTRQIALGAAQGTAMRDRAMADNLDFLLEERYPSKKVMVWAHNFHIQHRERVTLRDDGAEGSTPTTMGVWTARRHRPELYTIGLFMYRGAAALNGGRVYPILRMPAGSLESIMHRVPWRYSFVDLSRATRSPGTSWMFQRIPTMTWGTGLDPLVPRDEYDGILFIDTVHPPTYIWAASAR
jgi:erythromycin esterase